MPTSSLAMSYSRYLKPFLYVVSILATIGLNTILYFYLANFHDGTSMPAMLDAYHAHAFQFKATTILLAFLLAPMIVISGALAGRLWAADKSAYHQLSWIALVSDTAFLGAWGAAIGLGVASTAVVPYSPPEVAYVLVVGFAHVASILGVLWAPFGAACLLISIRSHLFPTWLNVLTMVAVTMNCCAVFGMFTMTGPLNPINGQVSAGFPFYGPVAWFMMLMVWLVTDGLSQKL